METVTTTTQDGQRQADSQPQGSSRRAAVNALATVGFIALILIGILLAIYAVRYVPKLVSDLGAGVSLSSIFHDGGDDENAALEVVTSTSTLPIIGTEIATTSDSSDTDDEDSSDSSNNSGSRGTGSAGTGTYTVTTVTQTPTINPHGDPDLVVTITGIGYLRDDGETDTFVSSSEVPDNKDGAVRFTVTNKGTNVSGRWKFEAEVPSSPSQTFKSPYQDSLKPGDRIDFVLGFEDGREGNNRDITVTVDPDDRIDESNERNNEAEREIDIED